MMKHGYSVAGLYFELVMPEGGNAPLPEAFAPFVSRGESETLFSFELTESLALSSDAELLLQDSNELGESKVYRGGEGCYYVEILFEGHRHLMWMDADFRKGRGCLDSSAVTAPVVLGSMLRIIFAQACPSRDALSVHASCVVSDGKGYLFMGKSGTGKSTHSRLWMEAFSSVWLLNDDNPILRLVDGGLFVYGSPWSGKTACYRNERVPVGALARLEQAGRNHLILEDGLEAFLDIYKGCSVLRTDSPLHDRLCDILTEVVEHVPVGHLYCLPDTDAARVCAEGLRRSEMRQAVVRRESTE